MISDNAVYVDGRRAAEPPSLREAHEAARGHRGLAWIGLQEPTEEELALMAEEFGLHELAVDDAARAHQRPKLERFGGTLFVALRSARYLDARERVEFGEVHVFVGEHFVITVRHGDVPDPVEEVCRPMEGEEGLLRRGPEAVLYAVLDRVIGGYAPVVDGLGRDIDEIEAEVFSGNAGVSRRIYELSREVIEVQRATKPLTGMLGRLIMGPGEYEMAPELQNYLRDVRDRVLRVIERVDGFRELLQSILSVNLTLLGVRQADAAIRQNEEVQRISAWAAILFAPTLIGTVYGMNFDRMPELRWVLGYPFALLLMALVSATLYLAFRRRGWI